MTHSRERAGPTAALSELGCHRRPGADALERVRNLLAYGASYDEEVDWSLFDLVSASMGIIEVSELIR